MIAHCCAGMLNPYTTGLGTHHFMIAHCCAGMLNPYTTGLGTHHFHDRSLLCRDAKPLYSGA
ncbi:hypothetical protein, partial [Vibrio crassostreae]|uniref:hypothetical protein n=1 Tax=Vibrio crassostreae TaxID=246167 RepID=UPI001B300582